PMFGIQPEVLYTMKGGKDETGATFKLKLNYIDIPVLAHIHWTHGSIMPFVVVGPTFSVRTKAEGEDTGGSFDLKYDFKKADTGISVGAGVVAGKLLVEARYTE